MKQDPVFDSEWKEMIRLAQNEARTSPGKEILGSLNHSENWASTLLSAQIFQQETQEMFPHLERDALWGPLSDLADPRSVLARLGKSSVLEIFEFALIRRWLYAVESWTEIPREEFLGERFKKAILQLENPRYALKILDQILNSDGQLSETATPKLASLIQFVRSAKGNIQQTLEQVVNRLHQEKVLQENFIDVRDQKYVIPVKASSQNEIEGEIAGHSASGQTVFIEPVEVSRLSLELKRKQTELEEEIYRIRKETSEKLFPFTDMIELSVSILSYWDATQAKARLGTKYSGKPIQVVENQQFDLKQTAHPLLWSSVLSENIIRNTIEWGGTHRVLLLTGPNAGGKTVLLKTLGMAAICARTGLTFPASENATVPFFDKFFADLGDPQSIEKHLSSFSGHVLKLKEILEQMSDQSLILLDELNSATDPEEGSAFSRAILEHLMERKAMTVATTHDPYLKALALTDERVLNASLEFNENFRSPTFKILLGVPGRSRALETAERLGIPEKILKQARTYLSKSHTDFEELLGNLQTHTFSAERLHREARHLRDEAQRLQAEWASKTESSLKELLDRTRARFKQSVQLFQDEVRTAVRKLDEAKNRKEIVDVRTKLNELFKEANMQIESTLKVELPEINPKVYSSSENPLPGVEASSLKLGEKVRLPKWKTTGVVLEITENKVKISLGAVQMTVSVQEIEKIRSPKS